MLLMKVKSFLFNPNGPLHDPTQVEPNFQVLVQEGKNYLAENTMLPIKWSPHAMLIGSCLHGVNEINQVLAGYYENSYTILQSQNWWANTFKDAKGTHVTL